MAAVEGRAFDALARRRTRAACRCVPGAFAVLVLPAACAGQCERGGRELAMCGTVRVRTCARSCAHMSSVQRCACACVCKIARLRSNILSVRWAAGVRPPAGGRTACEIPQLQTITRPSAPPVQTTPTSQTSRERAQQTPSGLPASWRGALDGHTSPPEELHAPRCALYTQKWKRLKRTRHVPDAK